MHSVPDGLPPLNFFTDFTAHLGNACVPMGILLLGGTLARLEIEQIPKGFWKSVIFMVCARLMVMPVIGILWANQLYRSNWVNDDISRFLVCIGWSIPSATAQVYFTAF
jgi:predicted permease